MKSTAAAAAAALAAAFWLGGCTELKQEPGKSYAGKEDAKPYAGDQFKGNRTRWEQTLASRNERQNDYARIPADKK